MRKTYVTKMPDEAGAFLVASRIITDAGGNIVRVNYNKAIDTHTLFLEVSAGQAQHRRIESELTACGYLTQEEEDRRILMVDLKLENAPGAVLPALEVISRYRANISYLSSLDDGEAGAFQHLKMGLLVGNTVELTRLMEELSQLCELKLLNYEVTDRLLDGTVFYVTFANEMRQILHLDQEQTNEVLIRANLLMQQLDEQHLPALQTFDYIRRMAEFVREHKGQQFRPCIKDRRLTDELYLTVIEPPCGSNTYVLRYRGALLFVDSGFSCYREEMLSLLRVLFPDFDKRSKTGMITHADLDHAGLLDLFDRTWMSKSCYDNFVLEHRGEKNYREIKPLHENYYYLSRFITEYAPPPLSRCEVVGEKTDDALFSFLGSRSFGPWRFDFYEGCGGHIKGETVIVCEQLKLLFSGDIYVNIKGFSPEQREYNRLAPFLMMGVDSDPALSKRSREEMVKRWPGYLICPGHGSMIEP